MSHARRAPRRPVAVHARTAVGTLAVAAVATVLLVTAVGDSPPAGPRPQMSAGGDMQAQQAGSVQSTAPYADVCDDADGDPLDLRRTEIGPGAGDTLRFAGFSCAAWPDELLDGRSLRWELAVPGGSAFAHVTIARQDGALVATVTEQPGGAVTHSAPAQRASLAEEARGVRADVPVGALGDPAAFDAVLTLHSGTAPVDTLPETDREPPLTYPEACPGVDAFTVERTAAVRGAQVTPDDPRVAEQWWLPEVNAPAAWRLRTGSGLAVAIVDDGVDATRADLAGRVAAGLDTRFDRPLPAGQSSDRGGHGTAVAGLAAAEGDNGVDLAGIDWTAQIVPYRVFDAAGCSDPLHVAAAVVHATDAGVPVINLSVGTTEDIPVLRDAVRYAFDRGVVLVSAVGNTGGETPLYPAAYPEVIGVGATLRGGGIAPYSSTGSQVWVVAPGGQSTGLAGEDLLTFGERPTLRPRAGTSFAVPLVAGGALLYRAIDPDSSAAVVAAAFARSAQDRGAPGRDPVYGHGLLDLHHLLVQAGVNRACPPGGVPDAGFADVGDGNVHASAIDCVVWWSVAQGVTPTAYAPRASVTRAQMATFIARTVEQATGAAMPVTGDHFPDDDGNHHEHTINKLASAGIVQGGADGRYRPREPVTRAQMAAFVVRAHEHIVGVALPADDAPFTDIAGNTHDQAIRKAFTAGLLRGQSPTSYGPRPAVRRDQMGSFLANLLGALARDGHASPPG